MLSVYFMPGPVRRASRSESKESVESSKSSCLLVSITMGFHSNAVGLNMNMKAATPQYNLQPSERVIINAWK